MPEMIVWNHDWAVPHGKLIVRGEVAERLFQGASAIFGKYFPQRRTPFREPAPPVWRSAVEGVAQEKLRQARRAAAAKARGHSSAEVAEEEVEVYMPQEIWRRFGIPSYTIETYMQRDDTALMHLEVTLFLLCRHAGAYAAASDRELRAKVAAAAAGCRHRRG